MGRREHSPTSQWLEFCNLGICLIDFGGKFIQVQERPPVLKCWQGLNHSGTVPSTAACGQRPRAPRKRVRPSDGTCRSNISSWEQRSHVQAPFSHPLPIPITGHGVQVVMVMGGGLKWEGIGKYCNARRLIRYAGLSKPVPSAWLRDQKLVNSPTVTQGGLSSVLLHLTMREPQLLTGIQENQKSDLSLNPAVRPWVNCLRSVSSSEKQ